VKKIILVVGIHLLPVLLHAAEPARGYQKKVTVAGETRLDWTFALSNRSLVNPPANWLGDHDSGKQSYELFVPPQYNAKQPAPLILFISAGNAPAGYRQLEPVCKQLGFLFASPHEAGNNCPFQKRVRIVLDILDDIRRNYNIDPDRTYLSGFSGGGRIACGIAFALPELFGGVMPVCACEKLREETWLRHRLIDRLSVALITGETDFNRGEVERWRGPYLKDIGVRTRVWTVPRMGHDIPTGAALLEAVRFLEEGVKQRQALAKEYPASRLVKPLSREEWAKALLDEAKARIKTRATLYSGLMQLKGAMERWTDLPEGEEAKRILLEYEAKPEKPWEADDIAEQRRFLIAQARALDAYASGPLPQQYARMRPDMARKALELWETIIEDGQDAKAVEEGKKRIPALQKLTGGK
jgi:hypothetical protein